MPALWYFGNAENFLPTEFDTGGYVQDYAWIAAKYKINYNGEVFSGKLDWHNWEQYVFNRICKEYPEVV